MLAAAALALLSAAAPLKVASLSEHRPTAWADRNCTATPLDRVTCNLRVYASAAAAAALENASLLVVPEAYGLSPRAEFAEPWISAVGSVPRTSGGRGTSPMQVGLSEIAAQHGVAIVANVFARLSNGTRRISDVVFDGGGAVLATYHKHHLFATELARFSRGPFEPTTFELGGRSLGLIICYEGVYPLLTGDWAQMSALRRMGADTFVWSVGGATPLGVTAGHMARKFNVSVVAAEDRTAALVLGPSGEPEPDARSVPFAVAGYTERKLALRVATLR